MQEIKCPNCGKMFQVDETGYAQILQQVRDQEFEKELGRREQELIDNAISALTKIRENLVKSENHLNTANNKLEDVSIKKLTKNAPTVRALFDEIKSET